jgi:hypothetical protein
MMTCMDYHETSLPPHLMIPIASILFHLVSLVAPNLPSHFTSYLPHRPWIIPQSFIPTPMAYPSHKQHLHVPCPSCGCLYITRTSLARHQTSCTTNKQSLTFEVSMPLALLSYPPFLVWLRIASLDIINVFHIGLPHPTHTIIFHMFFVLKFNVFCASF